MELVCWITVVIKLTIYTAVERNFTTVDGWSHRPLLWLM